MQLNFATACKVKIMWDHAAMSPTTHTHHTTTHQVLHALPNSDQTQAAQQQPDKCVCSTSSFGSSSESNYILKFFNISQASAHLHRIL